MGLLSNKGKGQTFLRGVLATASVAAIAMGGGFEVALANGADDGWSAGYEPGKVLVVFEQDVSKASADHAVMSVQSVDGKAVDADALESPVKMAKVDVAEGATVEEAIAELEADGAVAYAQPNYLYKLLDSPNGQGSAVAALDGAAQGELAITSLQGGVGLQVVGTNDNLRYKQWYLSSINAYKSWDTSRCNGNVTVAVLDTGITMNHYDLKDRIVAPYDVVGDARTDNSESVPDNSPDDESGHGTHVAGIIAAHADNGFGTVGVSYNANIMPLKVCYYSDSANTYITSSEDLASAYSYLLSRAPEDVNGDGTVGTYADEYNVRVANMSLGALYDEMSMTEAEKKADKAVLDLVDRARTRGILTVCAAGNEASSEYSWPSDHPSCVSVIALDKNDSRASYSNFGPQKDISAPGSDIFSTVPMSYSAVGTTVRDPDGDLHCYSELSGTSMASPVVAGVAAQVFAANPNLTPGGVEDILYATAVDLGDPGKDDQFGYGKVDADAAVKAANSIAATSIEDLPTLAKVGVGLELTGNVLPATATHRDISFELVDAGTTGATIAGNTFTATAPGTAVLKATVANGGANGADLVRQFSITVLAASTPSNPGGTGDSSSAGGSDDTGDAGAKSVSLRVGGLAASYAYTGGEVRPALKVTLGGRELKAGSEYEIAYTGNRNIGTAKGLLTLSGNYSGKAAFSFKITAPAVPSSTVKKLKAGKKSFTATWQKLDSSQVSGYQLRYSTAKSMKGAKTKTVRSAATAKLSVKKLKAKKAYYVQVRAYRTIGSKTFYGTWSAAKKVKTKK